MSHHPRARFWIELGLAVASAALLIVTLIWNEWIELLFHVDPDASSGAAEWLVVGVTICVTLVSLVLARIEWSRSVAEARLTA